jgi:ankyrin repeat protein
LSKALECGNPKLVEVLSARLMADADCLATAARHANLGLADFLLSAGAIPDVESLLGAVQGGCLKVTERFLNLGVSPNTMAASGTTPLVVAILICRHALLQLFESKGFFSELSLGHASRWEALQAACKSDNAELVQLLLSSIQKDPSSLPNHSVKQMLQDGYREVALKLVELGAPLDADIIVLAIEQRNAWLVRRCINQVLTHFVWVGMQVLYHAVHWGDLEIIKALVHAGVDLHEAGSYHFLLDEYSPMFKRGEFIYATPLVASIWMAKREVTDVLLDLGALGRGNHKSMMSPLTAAIIMRDSNLVRDLLERGADPYDNKAIALASFSQNLPLAICLLRHFEKSYPMGLAGFGAEALHEAIRKENIPMLSELAKYADGNILLAVPGNGLYVSSLSPLGAAISSGSEKYIQMMEILLENRTNANAVVFGEPNGSRTAIMYAISNRRLAAVELLIKHGAAVKPQARNLPKLTPLQFATELGMEDIVQCLLKYVVPNEKPETIGGATALQWAAIKGYYRIAVLLLGRGADVNAAPAPIEGRTAFEGAAEHGRMDMMLLLAQHGVDLLANDEAQYKRAIRYSKGNGQIGAMMLVEQLHEKALQEVQMEGVLTPGLFLDGSMTAKRSIW